MNILIIIEDAVRPRHMGCYGYPKDTTPHCDRLAREGVLFSRCFSVSSHTLPPVVSLLTGQNVSSHGLQSPADYAGWSSNPRWQGRRTPLHLLREHGWLVDGELVTRWQPLGFERDENDLPAYLARHRGCDWFYLAMPYPTHLPYSPPQEYYELFVDPAYRPDAGTRARLDTVCTRMILHPPGVISAMEAGRKDPIGEGDEAHKRSYATVEFVPDLDRPGVHALYDGELRVFDDLVGAWVARLEELDLLEDTLLVITSDHGEELLERGHVGHTSCNLKGTLYDECVHVPLILRYPRGLPQGLVIDQQVSQIDLMPTVFDLLGLPLELPCDGRSLLPLVRGETTDFRPEVFAETMPAGWQALEGDHRRLWMVRTSDWKLIYREDPGTLERAWELYDLRQDPGETRNRYAAEPLVANRLRASLEAEMARAAAARAEGR